MYRKELLPDCILAGMTAEEFWHSYPCEVEPYLTAYRKKIMMEDRLNYYTSIYILEDFQLILSGMFGKKGAQPMKHRQRPIIEEVYEKTRPMTPEEIKEREKRESDKIFHRLEIARFNQELANM